MKLESLNLWTSFRELLETEIKESREEGRIFDPEPAVRAAAPRRGKLRRNLAPSAMGPNSWVDLQADGIFEGFFLF